MNWLKQFTDKAQNIIQRFCEVKNETDKQQRHKDEITAIKESITKLDKALNKLDNSIVDMIPVYTAFHRIVCRKLNEQGIVISNEEIDAEIKQVEENIRNNIAMGSFINEILSELSKK